jgi:hypothetical protein
MRVLSETAAASVFHDRERRDAGGRQLQGSFLNPDTKLFLTAKPVLMARHIISA